MASISSPLSGPSGGRQFLDGGCIMEGKTQGAILVVDDDTDLRQSLAAILARQGYEVRTAKDSDDAMNILNSYRPDLFILDLMMNTDTEGFDLACALRAKPAFANTPIIMLTCFLEKVREQGPDHFQNLLGEEWPANWLFEKPVDTTKLVRKIQRLLGQA
jgi:DNA-binding response OmpR family regulator